MTENTPFYPSDEEILGQITALNIAQKTYISSSEEEKSRAYTKFDEHLHWLISRHVEFYWDPQAAMMRQGRPDQPISS